MGNDWDRVVSFVDRFGARRDILLMAPERHRLCVNCYGRAWPAVRAWLAQNWLLRHVMAAAQP